MKRHFTLKPVLLIELLMVAVLAGIGAAFAITVNPLPNAVSPWAGQESITDAANLRVTDYSFSYNADLTEITGVTVEVTNIGAANHQGTVNVAVGDAGVQETASPLPATVLAGTSLDFVCTLSAGVPLGNASWIHIIVDEQ
jgi:hypothetical protein